MKVMRHILILIFFAASLVIQAQNTSLKVIKEDTNYAFGQIFTDFRYSVKDSYKPQAAFNFNQGIIGYVHNLSSKLRGFIMLDVTRTTHFYSISDTAGNLMNYSYFEGSKYTAFLKMAEIRWNINDFFTFRIGQLLNTQYLTFQDRFWGYRYIDVTFQERYRMGMPADFGAQLDFKYKDKILNQFSIVNGEGPFRYQDANSKFLFSNNIQFYPNKHMTLKLYVDYAPSPDTGMNKAAKSVLSGFAGYKTEKWRLGSEYVFVSNYGFNENTEYFGFSIYGSVVVSPKIQVLVRYDHLNMSLPIESQLLDYYIVGFQWEPLEMFTTSLNFRYYSIGHLPFIHASFGLKF